ncbi:hypothetical protein C662_09700 [Thauera sp. 28]|nr:hypothetical protein C662_09700 [Thauera sp. 28]
MRPLRMQRCKRVQLPPVMIHVVVLLAQQHDIAPRHGSKQRARLGPLGLCGIEPGPGAGCKA